MNSVNYNPSLYLAISKLGSIDLFPLINKTFITSTSNSLQNTKLNTKVIKDKAKVIYNSSFSERIYC